jgi:transposase
VATASSTRDRAHRDRVQSVSAPGSRNRVERSVGRLKQFRRVATRYDKRAGNYLAWVTLATTLIWL